MLEWGAVGLGLWNLHVWGSGKAPEALLVVPTVRAQERDLVPSAPDNTQPLRF